MKAIIYTSNSGFTEKYAKMLAEETGLPCYSLKNAVGKVEAGADIIYLGWLMAGIVKGYKKAAKKYSIKAVCGVGMAAGDEQAEESRKVNHIPTETPYFTMQGGFDINKLHGIYKFMMGTMKITAGKKLAEKPDRTPVEDDMLDLMQNNGDRVKKENLAPVISWYNENK